MFVFKVWLAAIVLWPVAVLILDASKKYLDIYLKKKSKKIRKFNYDLGVILVSTGGLAMLLGVLSSVDVNEIVIKLAVSLIFFMFGVKIMLNNL